MDPKTRPGTSWYRIENKVGAGAAEVYLYDEIGAWGISASQFVADLNALRTSAAIDLHVSSPGGEAYDGLTIFNALRNHPAKVTVYIDGLAASAASFVAMAGDRIVAERNASIMIHNAHCVAMGDHDDMIKMAAVLDRMSGTIATIYSERAGGTAADWRARMKTETWYSADEAKEAGLVDEVIAPAAPARGVPRNSWDLSIFNFAGRAAAPDPFAAAVTDTAAPPAVEPIAKPPTPAVVPDTPPAEPTVTDEPETEALPQSQADEWADLTAALTTEDLSASTGDDEFARLTEALL